MDKEKTGRLESLIQRLSEGEDIQEAVKEFQKEFGAITETEMAEMENELIASGTPVSEIGRLCDVHAQAYLALHPEEKDKEPERITPIAVMKGENIGIKSALDFLRKKLTSDEKTDEEDLRKAIVYLDDLPKHYEQKEALFFPYLLRHSVKGPVEVMWSVDDDIRAELRKVREAMASSFPKEEALRFVSMAEGMVTKEEEILFPLIEKTLTPEEMAKIGEEMPDLGYPFLLSSPRKEDFAGAGKKEIPAELKDGKVTLATGTLSLTELSSLLNALPVELTFLDQNDAFVYFNSVPSPVFRRTKAELGENVEACHPAKALPAVRAILEDLHSGKKDSVDFFFTKGKRKINNRYLALRDEKGNYLGCLEVTEDVTEILRIRDLSDPR
jgi:DUF438 domain-containing protein